jgi:predicted acyl esterase
MVESFRSLEHVWIEMPDGVRLAARIWLPSSALTKPAPAVFEYIPYRKVDMVRARDERNHPYLAENGYEFVEHLLNHYKQNLIF